MPPHFSWLKGGQVNFDSEILDVGCGTGSFLNLLSRDGFTRLRGADPFIPQDIAYDNGVVIWKKTIPEVQEKFDFVMMHHAFEHMAEPLAVLREIRRVLKPNRRALIRIPIAGSFAWRKYGVHWAQLDAPRHLFLHTVDSMTRLAGQAGLELESVFYDSNSAAIHRQRKVRERHPPDRQRERSPVFRRGKSPPLSVRPKNSTGRGRAIRPGFICEKESANDLAS